MTDKKKLEKIKSLADKMYYTAHYLTTDASHLRKAMDEYHQFIINDYHKEEPVSEDLEEAAVEAFKHIVDSDKNSFLEIFKAGAKWKEEQIIKNAIDAKDVDFDAEWKKYFEHKGEMATVNVKHLAKYFFELGIKALKGE